MPRQKLKHFAEMKEWDHVFEPTFEQPLDLKGSWGPHVILELACGAGAYTVALAERFSEAIVVGVDIKGSRIWHGAQEAREQGLSNARFLRTRIERLADYFAPGEVDEIWITFPNPHPTEGNARRRLTSPRFLAMYASLLKPAGLLHLKTDDEALFDYSVETAQVEGWRIAEQVRDVHALPGQTLLQEIQTFYERRYVAEGKRILYASWAQYSPL